MKFFRDSTWEPEKHILDRALIHFFEQRQRGKHLQKRGPKKKNYVSQKDKIAEAREKARIKSEVKNEEEDNPGESDPGISCRLQEADHEDALQTGTMGLF